MFSFKRSEICWCQLSLHWIFKLMITRNFLSRSEKGGLSFQDSRKSDSNIWLSCEGQISSFVLVFIGFNPFTSTVCQFLWYCVMAGALVVDIIMPPLIQETYRIPFQDSSLCVWVILWSRNNLSRFYGLCIVHTKESHLYIMAIRYQFVWNSLWMKPWWGLFRPRDLAALGGDVFSWISWQKREFSVFLESTHN